jgi:hypothetical protein
VRDRELYSAMAAFTEDAAGLLVAETAAGAEIPFELIESDGRPGRVPLYCYRPLTEEFIHSRLGLLTGLATYSAAVRGLSSTERAGDYLIARGAQQVPGEPREKADAVLLAFLDRVFAERTEFGFEPARFEVAYEELEVALFEGRHVTMVVAPLLGLAFEPGTPEVALGDGLSLIPGARVPDAPAEAIWSETGEPHVLVSLTVTADDSRQAAVSLARRRFRRVLTALRLFEQGGFALGPLGWTRIDSGSWRPVALGGSGRPRMVTLIPARQEDELQAFCNLIARRTPASGEVAWALARFDMGCERLAPFEALTDHLLALRALLEPEGPASGRLAQRLAVLCATPDEHGALAERTARAISLERAVIAGLASAQRSAGADGLVAETSEHLRALLRDVLCGHLDADLVRVADGLLSAAVSQAGVVSDEAAAVSDEAAAVSDEAAAVSDEAAALSDEAPAVSDEAAPATDPQVPVPYR